MSEDRMQGIPRFDAHLVTDACGNKDVLMKEAHDGLFVRYEDASRALQKLRGALEEADLQIAEWKSVAGEYAETHPQDCGCLPCLDYKDALSGANRSAALREAK